jgi:microcystin-dependent protein
MAFVLSDTDSQPTTILNSTEIIVGNNNNVVNAITGTPNQIITSGATGNVTLSLPQSISPTSNVVFNKLQITDGAHPGYIFISDSQGHGSWGLLDPSGIAGVAAITGTPNQIITSGATGNVTLSLPQSISPSSNVIFNQITTPTIIATNQNTTNILATTISSELILCTQLNSNFISTQTLSSSSIYSDSLYSDDVLTTSLNSNTVTASDIIVQNCSCVNLTTNLITSEVILTNTITASGIVIQSCSCVNLTSETLNSISVTTSSITAQSCSCVNLTSETLNSNTITSGIVTVSGQLTAQNLIVSDISANTLNVGTIYSNSVEASSMSVTDVNCSSTIISTGAIIHTVSAGILSVSGLSSRYLTSYNITVSGLNVSDMSANTLNVSTMYSNSIETSSLSVLTDISCNTLNCSSIWSAGVNSDTVTCKTISCSGIDTRKVNSYSITTSGLYSYTMNATEMITTPVLSSSVITLSGIISTSGLYQSLVLDISSNTISCFGGTANLSPVLSILSTPPLSPSLYASYIIDVSGTGVWSGKEGQIATWNGNSWLFYQPNNDDKVTITTGSGTGLAMVYNTGSWTNDHIGATLPTYNWVSTQSYLQNDISINSGNLYQANSYIPINTPFSTGLSGSTWKQLNAGTALLGDIKYSVRTTDHNNWLLCDGSSKSRTTYPDLFNLLAPSLGTCIISIASPCVVTLSGHGLVSGDAVSFETTGSLPTGIVITTKYYVNVLSVNTFNISLTYNGILVNTTGSQSGVQSARSTPYGNGNGTTTFNLPDPRGRTLGATGQGSGLTYRNKGLTVGEETHTLTESEMPSHSHSFTSYVADNTATIFIGGSLRLDPGGSSYGTSSTGGSQAHNNMQPTIFISNVFIYSVY